MELQGEGGQSLEEREASGKPWRGGSRAQGGGGAGKAGAGAADTLEMRPVEGGVDGRRPWRLGQEAKGKLEAGQHAEVGPRKDAADSGEER